MFEPVDVDARFYPGVCRGGGLGMAINSAQPVDGLIYRLLQQNSKHSASASTRPTDVAADSATISAQARNQQPMHSVESQLHAPAGNGGRSLESHLLSLCKLHDLNGD